MKVSRINFKVAVFFATCFSIFTANAVAMRAPDVVAQETIATMVNNIQSKRTLYENDTQALYDMVEEVLVPTIHVDRMAKLILGKENARAATKEQRARFAEEFKTFLMRSYATALLDYTGDEEVIFEPVELAPGADKVTVKAKLVAADGQTYPVNLYMSNRRDTEWRAYNIDVAGINFVGTYRSTFGDIIERKGIEGLITELHDKNLKLAE